IYKYENGSIVFEDWDSNGNGIFAEWKGMKKDKLDLMPDVYVGRLACRSKIELKIVIDKIIKYESENQASKEWFKKMVVVAGDTFPQENDPYFDGEVSTEKALEYMNGYEGIKLYTSTGTLSDAKDIINAVSNGCGFLNFEGHGNPMSWATHPPYDESTWIGIDVTQFPMLSNKDMYPVCVVGGCHNSQFNVSIFNLLKIKQLYETYYKSEWSPGCFNEWIVRKIDGGAIASIGCTGLGYGYVGDENKDGIPDCIQGLGGWIDIEFFRLYGQEHKNILGEIHSTAIANYVAKFPVMKDEIDCKTVQEWALLGDPTLKIGGYS
ncbi:MAG: C25 family cysteine peptidase, partial [Candidatus Thermoplasmatota archaeon]